MDKDVTEPHTIKTVITDFKNSTALPDYFYEAAVNHVSGGYSVYFDVSDAVIIPSGHVRYICFGHRVDGIVRPTKINTDLIKSIVFK